MKTPDLFTPPADAQAAEIPESDRCDFIAYLDSVGIWQNRQQIAAALQWDVRYVREVAESVGSDVVRCQRGYKLTDQITREELPFAIQAADAFHSQASKMAAYSLSLRKRLHALVG